jgi:hypothetical protein
MNLAYLVAFSRVKQDALARCGFTRVNVRHNADVSSMF